MSEDTRSFEEWIYKKTHRSCLLCGRTATERHHIQYQPDQILVDLCSSCHRTVHNDPDYDHLRPDTAWKDLSMGERTEIETTRRRGDVTVITDRDELPDR